MENKTLLFEGAGWNGAEHNGVGNCRIRTRIKNKDSRIIYFEAAKMGSGINIGRVNHCFDMQDEKNNRTKDLSYIERLNFPYTHEGILSLINEHLNCDFTEIKVIYEGLRVHANKEPICSCQ